MLPTGLTVIAPSVRPPVRDTEETLWSERHFVSLLLPQTKCCDSFSHKIKLALVTYIFKCVMKTPPKYFCVSWSMKASQQLFAVSTQVVIAACHFAERGRGLYHTTKVAVKLWLRGRKTFFRNVGMIHKDATWCIPVGAHYRADEKLCPRIMLSPNCDSL